MNNNYQGKKIEYHILQSFPVSCLNRDDVGAPKTAMIGGVTRARVSSQAWKRQVRLQLHALGIKTAVRTKQITEKILNFCPPDYLEKAKVAASIIAKILAKDTLYFFSDSEASGLADFIVDKNYFSDISEKELESKSFAKEIYDIQKEASKKGFKDLDGLDIALFGRMVANAASLSVESSTSFAHAISTHKISNEIDFFTALDDEKVDEDDDAGASHIGNTEFNSATYYRYISLDLGQLVDTLGSDENIDEAVSAFTKALFLAVPYAKQSTMTGSTPWDFARIYVRKGQRLQASFENPIKAKGEGFLKPSIEALKSTLDDKEKMFGSLFGEIAKFEWGQNVNFSIDDLIDGLVKAIHEG